MLFTHKTDLYTKDNLIIVVTGKIQDAKTVEKLIGELFKDLPAAKRIEKPVFSNYLPMEKVGFYDQKNEQNHLVISAPGFDGANDQRYAANVLATILGGNMSSRLFQNIREKQGLCYYIKGFHLSSEAT
jgi:predicted Zn-dependent peptidase